MLKFCAQHRLPESHTCQFDHKSKGLDLLETKLVLRGSEKLVLN